MKKTIVITGSEGLIGKKLVDHLKKQYNILKLDIQLGNDLTNEKYVEDYFKAHKNLYGLIVCHAHNPLPLENAEDTKPIDVSLNEIRDYILMYVDTLYLIIKEE